MSGIVEGADTLIGPGARVASPPVGPRVAFRFGGGVGAQGKPHDASGPPQNPLQGVQRAKPCRVNRLEDETSSVPTCSERAVCGVGGSCPSSPAGLHPPFLNSARESCVTCHTLTRVQLEWTHALLFISSIWVCDT